MERVREGSEVSELRFEVETEVGDGDLVELVEVELVQSWQLKRWRDQPLSHQAPPLLRNVTSVCGADESDQHGLVVDLSGHHRVCGRQSGGEVCGDARSSQVAPRGVGCGWLLAQLHCGGAGREGLDAKFAQKTPI